MLSATVLGGVVLVLAAAALVLAGLIHQLSLHSVGSGIAIVLTFTGVGVIVSRRQPGNPIGWLLLSFAVLYILSSGASYYAVLHYRLGHSGLPFAAAALLLSTLRASSFALFPPVILLFPDGRLASRPWRWLLWAYAGLVAYLMIVLAAPAVAAVAGHRIRLDSSGNLTDAGHLAGWIANPPAWFITPVLAATVVIGLSFVGHQVFIWRAAAGERRQQLKWLASGAAVAVVSLVLAALLGLSVLLAGIVALPVSIAVGILKYRLYEIDRIISRTLAYAIVTSLLVGVYAGLVLLATPALPFSVSTPVAVAGATLAAAALFNPLRQRVQRTVDRRFNRARYDADKTVAAFAAGLQGAVDLNSVQDDLASVVRKALEPAHVSVWMSERG